MSNNTETLMQKIENEINSGTVNPTVVGTTFFKIHRFLQDEIFRCLVYPIIRCLSNAYESNRYDARNEYACRIANVMIIAYDEKFRNGHTVCDEKQLEKEDYIL